MAGITKDLLDGVRQKSPLIRSIASYVTVNAVVMWLVGFVLYRVLMKVDMPVGCTLPAMAGTLVAYLLSRRFLSSKAPAEKFRLHFEKKRQKLVSQGLALLFPFCLALPAAFCRQNTLLSDKFAV
ncbi:MAG: hypothetical protein VB023_06445 [Oscillibacter sp.]|nr:hypothetical protein [Oscillibacter sp.]